MRLRYRPGLLTALLSAAILLAPAILRGQLVRDRPCRVTIVVITDGNEKVRAATVELMDSVGQTSAMSSKFTSSDGRAEFNSYTGGHRVRITGAEIENYEGEFQITVNEANHLETIRVKRKPAVGENKPPEGTGNVPSVRLNVSPKATKEFEKGSKALQQKKWEEARRFFEAALAISPDYDLAYNGLGVAASSMNDMPAARAAFAKAIQCNPKFAGAQRNLARILLEEKNYAEANSLLMRSLAIEPTNTWAMTNAANTALELKRYQEAAALARRVHLFPHQDYAEAHMIAGYALESLGQTADAVAEFQLYLKEAPAGINAQRARENIARLTAGP